jgi:ribonuclease P protein subunit POP4
MDPKPKNLAKHELISRVAEVVRATDPKKLGIKGKVVDETRNILVISMGGQEKRVPKAECTFRFELDRSVVEVDGKLLVGRPEDRIKKRVK